MSDNSTDIMTSPDGVWQVEYNVFGMRMSHVVYNPRVTHLPTGKVVMDYWNTLWDGAVTFDEAGRLHMHLREYPGSTPGHDVVIDPRTLETKTLAEFTAEQERAAAPPAAHASASLSVPAAVVGQEAAPKEQGKPLAETPTDFASLKPAVSSSTQGRHPPTEPVTASQGRIKEFNPRWGWLVILGPWVAIAIVFVLGGKALATWTPLSHLPWWAGWSVGGSLSVAALLVAVLVWFVCVFRKYRGN